LLELPEEDEEEDDEEEPDDGAELGAEGVLGGAGALGVGAEGVGTDGVGTEGVGTDGADGVSTQVCVPGTVVTGVVTPGVSTQVCACTGNTAAAKAAHAAAIPMSRMRLFMTLPPRPPERQPYLDASKQFTLPESFRARASTVQGGFRGRKRQPLRC
jgi:hypothetical protein